MSCSFNFARSVPTTSPVRASAARVYSASRDPVTVEDRYEAARHSSKQFWDVALLGGPHLVRHGGRALVAHDSGRAFKQLLPGVALSAAAVGFLPLTGIISAIYSRANPRTLASPEATYVYRLKTAIAVHKKDINSQRYMIRSLKYGELGLYGEVAEKVDESPIQRVKYSNSLDWQIGVWRRLLLLMPENP